MIRKKGWPKLTPKQLHVLRTRTYEKMIHAWTSGGWKPVKHEKVKRWVCEVEGKEVDVTNQVRALRRRRLVRAYEGPDRYLRVLVPTISPRGLE